MRGDQLGVLRTSGMARPMQKRGATALIPRATRFGRCAHLLLLFGPGGLRPPVGLDMII